MRCKNLIPVGQHYVPCGQCLACRINRRREWLARLHLEALDHDVVLFATLTYSDEFLPRSEETGVPDLNL